MPRPTKLTPLRQRAICTAIEQGATYEVAALGAGITYETLNEWHKHNPQFAEALKAADARGVLACLARIQQAAKDGQWQAAAWILERRHPADYGRRDRIEMEHSGTLDVRVLADLHRVIVEALVDDPGAQLKVAEALAALDAPQEGGESDGDDAGQNAGDRRP